MSSAIASPSGNRTSTTQSVAEPATTFGTFLTIALLAAGTDLVTKALATHFLRNGRVVTLASKFGFELVHNTGIVGGSSIGPMTWVVNVLMTALAIIMVMRIVTPLAAVDPRATLALGLVSGGALGNLASVVIGNDGVTDFIAVQLGSETTIVMNVADLILWTGALMLVPVVVALLRAVVAERADASERVAEERVSA